jgi:hypothetical protein
MDWDYNKGGHQQNNTKEDITESNSRYGLRSSNTNPAIHSRTTTSKREEDQSSVPSQPALASKDDHSCTI